MGLEGSVQTAVRQSLLGQVIRQATSFGLGILLARLLVPRDFGVVALAMIAIAFAQVLVEAGLGPALVQRPNLTRHHWGSALVANMAAAVALAALLWFAAPWVAEVLGDARIIGVTRLLTLTLPLAALTMAPRAWLQRDLRFGRVVAADTVSMFVSLLLAVALAVGGYGMMALVAQALVASLIQTAWLLSALPAREIGRPTWAAVGELWSFGRHVLGSRTLTYWGYNLDNLLVGKWLGAFALGLYTKAYALLLLPLANGSRILNQVLLPAYSRLADDPAGLRSAHSRALAATAIIVVPVAWGLGMTAEPLVLALYGAKWSGMISVLQILAVVLPLVAIRQVHGNLFLAVGRPQHQFRLDLALKAVTLVAMLIGLRWGLPGVAAGLAMAILINAGPHLVLANRLINYPMANLLEDAWPALAGGLLMVAAVAATMALLPSLLAWQQLAILVAVGAAVYGGYVALVQPAGARDVWAGLRRSRA